MEHLDRIKHWEKIYQNKDLKDLSWFEQTPTISLEFLEQFKISKTAKIIDIGGGDSFFVDHLLFSGYQDITVLDISESALNKAKIRLAEKADKVKWIVADIADFNTTEKYDFWHDRAAFHFLTQEHEIVSYIDTVQKSINAKGILVMGTFSKKGPEKCSGIEIKQYSEASMTEQLGVFFEKIKCVTVDHVTPFKTFQSFIFCSFKKSLAE